MSDLEQLPAVSDPVVPYRTLGQLRTEHAEYLRLYRKMGADKALLTDVEKFLLRGRATGAILGDSQDRFTAQGLMDFWLTVFYGAGEEPPDPTLVAYAPYRQNALQDVQCPYVGLLALDEDSKDLFFGRLLSRLRDSVSEHRLVAVVGPPGSSKSSLVLEGLLPLLKDGKLRGSDRWHYCPVMIPGKNPLDELAHAVRSPDAGDPIQWVQAHAEKFRRDPGLLAKIAGRLGKPAVLVVDRFEQVFTHCQDEQARGAFIDNLVGLAGAPGAEHRVILVVRSEFEARLDSLKGAATSGKPVPVVDVTPPTEAELREVIERPAERIGLRFEPGLVEQIVKDVQFVPPVLPILNYLLLKLWEERQEGDLITSDAYKNLGTARQVLAKGADLFFDRLSREEKEVVRHIFLRLGRPLVGQDLAGNRLLRSALERQDYGDRVDQVLRTLVDAGLVRVIPCETPAADQIEVVHPALLESWPRLLNWRAADWPPNPYRGLEPFEQQHAGLFFGRRRITSTWVDTIARDPLLAIFGPSGSGKTSVVQAGILPSLAANHWLTLPVRPFDSPFEFLAESLAKAGCREDAGDLLRRLRSDPVAFLDVIKELAGPDQKVILYIDQFEELFTICHDPERSDFLSSVFHHLRTGDEWATSSLRLILTFRSDYFDRVMAHADLATLLGRHVVGITAMKDAEIREAIVEPARINDVEVEEQLVTKIIADMVEDHGEEGDGKNRTNLPLMEFCLQKLWAEQAPARGERLTLDAYVKIGEFRGVIGQHANSVFDKLRNQGLERTVRAIFMQLIKVTQTGEPGRDARRPATMAELASIPSAGGEEMVDRAVKELTAPEHRLLVRSGRQGDSAKTVEIAHEVLIREWKTLRKWIDRQRGFYAARDRVKLLSANEESLSPEMLEQCRQWLEDSRGEELDSDVREYIKVSLKKHAELEADKLIGEMPELVPRTIREIRKDKWLSDCIRRRLGEAIDLIDKGKAVDDKGRDLRRNARRYRAVLLDMGDQEKLPHLLKSLLTEMDATTFTLVRDWLVPYWRHELTADVWKRVRDHHLEDDERLRAACLLAKFDPDDSVQWESIAEKVAKLLVESQPLAVPHWAKALRPVKRYLRDPLARILRGHERTVENEQDRTVAGNLLVEFAGDWLAFLAEQIVEADIRSYPVILKKIKEDTGSGPNSPRRVLERILAGDRLGEETIRTKDEVDRRRADEVDRRRAVAAVTLQHLDSENQIWPMLRQSDHPGVRSYIIHLMAPLGIPADLLIERLLRDDLEDDVRMAILLALGEYRDRLPTSLDDARWLVAWFESRAPGLHPAAQWLDKWFESHPHPGVHSAVQWLWTRWPKLLDLRTSVPKGPPKDPGPRDGFGWYVNGQSQTLAIVKGPVETSMGSPDGEPGRYDDEDYHRQTIDRSFAIATTTVTVEQFQQFDADWKPDPRYMIEPAGGLGLQSPAIGITWFQAAQYCNWLSREEGLTHPDQLCYPEFKKGDNKSPLDLPADFLGRPGYRLPTEAEWEHACRAGTVTARSYGDGEALLKHYAWYNANSENGVHPCASLKPNDLGLFDTLGNVLEWCQDAYRPYDKATRPAESDSVIDLDEKRILRGGAFTHSAANHRSACREKLNPNVDLFMVGFRVARTLPAPFPGG
ncbi:MAG: formylglycine-generating enzyme family protein [Isosphaerales bacterium]